MLFWILLLVLVSIAYALLIIWVLPKLILRSNYPITHSSDRGLKKYKFSDDDYAVVYEPSLSTRKYVTQYILAKRDGKKTFKGKIAPNVTYIDFDIALFDGSNRCFSVINSMNIVGEDGLTEDVDLPQETSYVSIIVNQVDKKQIKQKIVAKVGIFRLIVFGLSALLLSVVMAVFAMLAFSFIFGGLFKETFAVKMISSGWVFIFPTIISAACITGACYTLFLRNSKR